MSSCLDCTPQWEAVGKCSCSDPDNHLSHLTGRPVWKPRQTLLSRELQLGRAPWCWHSQRRLLSACPPGHLPGSYSLVHSLNCLVPARPLDSPASTAPHSSSSSLILKGLKGGISIRGAYSSPPVELALCPLPAPRAHPTPLHTQPTSFASLWDSQLWPPRHLWTLLWPFRHFVAILWPILIDYIYCLKGNFKIWELILVIKIWTKEDWRDDSVVKRDLFLQRIRVQIQLKHTDHVANTYTTASKDLLPLTSSDTCSRSLFLSPPPDTHTHAHVI